MVILSDISDIDIIKFIETEKKDKDYFKESQIQNMIIQYLESNNIDFHVSFNGLKIKSFGQRRFMKSQGMRKGHSDLIIEKKNGTHEVLFLELKTIKGVLSKEQSAWIKKKLHDGYAVSVSYGYYDAIYKIAKYLNNETIYYKGAIANENN